MLYKTFANNSARINGIGVTLNEMDKEKMGKCDELHCIALLVYLDDEAVSG